MIDEAKEFLAPVMRLTEIQPVPDVFKGTTLTDDGRRPVSGPVQANPMWISDAGIAGVHIFMARDTSTWAMSFDGSRGQRVM